MRIAGYIDHPLLKITIFQMENKYAVKFEHHGLEQTYKFNTGHGLERVEDVRQLVNATFLSSVIAQMQQMDQLRAKALEQRTAQEEDEFEDII
jgi:hypothetical protein